MMDYEKMNFAEALHYLGEKVGVEVGKIKNFKNTMISTTFQ